MKPKAWLRELGLLAVFVTAAVAVVAVVDPPPTEEQLTQAFRSLGFWAFAFAGAMALLEVGTPIGLIAPAEFAVPLAGAAAAAGSVPLPLVIGAIWASAALGESLSFLAGRRLGREFVDRHGPRLRVTPERRASFDAHFARHGRATVVLARFGPYVRTLTPFLAGGSRMPYPRFLAASLLGTGLWTVLLCTGGFFMFEHIRLVRDLALGLGIGLIVTAAILFMLPRLTLSRRRRVRVFADSGATQPGSRGSGSGGRHERTRV